MICCARFWCSAAWCHGLRQTLAFHLNLWVYLTHNFGCLCFISDWLGHPAACCCVSVFAFHEAPDQPRHRAVMENFGFSFRHVVAWDEAFLRKTRHWKSEILIEIWNLIICMPYAICNANATRKFRFGLEILLTNYPLSLYSVHSYYKLLLLSYYWLISTHWLIDSLSLLITNIFFLTSHSQVCESVRPVKVQLQLRAVTGKFVLRVDGLHSSLHRTKPCDKLWSARSPAQQG